MTTTSWSHSSKTVVAVCLLLAAAAVPVGAATVADSSVPGEGAAGSEVEITVTLTELYQDPQLEQWQLAGSTALETPTWTIAFVDQTGSQVDQQSFGGQSFDGVNVSAAQDHAEVRITLTGTVPEPTEYTYDPHQSITAVSLQQVPPGGGGSTLVEESLNHFTEESDSAREAITSAETAVESAGNPSEASGTLEQAIEAYENENFELATDLAGEAQSEAEAAQNTQNRNRLLLIGGGVVVLLALLGGGVWYLRQQNQRPDRLG